MSSGRGAAGRSRGVTSECTTASRLAALAGGSATEPTRRSPVYRGVRSCPSSCLSPSADGLTHAHAGGHTLAQGSRGDLDARGPAVFRVPRALAIELAETLDVVDSGSPDRIAGLAAKAHRPPSPSPSAFRDARNSSAERRPWRACGSCSRRAGRDALAHPFPAELRADSALDEREQVRIDHVGVCRTHAVWELLVDFQGALP